METLTLKSLEVAVAALPKMQGMLLEKIILSKAFSLVENKADWKGPINAKVATDFCEVDADVICRAVEFFTATTAKVTKNDDGSMTVTAKGYRAGDAGDH